MPRDPRFLQVTGEFDAKRFQNQYNFLSDLHQNELGTLKDNLKRARKLLANSPRDLREEREGEVDRLERAVKRAESLVNKDRREKVETEALRKLAKDEREKRKQGKKAWYMKDGTLSQNTIMEATAMADHGLYVEQRIRRICSYVPSMTPLRRWVGRVPCARRLRRSRRRSTRRKRRGDRLRLDRRRVRGVGGTKVPPV